MGKHKTPAEREIALRVGARIRQLREIQHVSQIRLATEIGIRAGPLGWIEKGKHLPSGRVLYRIAKQLNVRLDDLFQETDVWQSSAPTVSVAGAVVLPPFEMEAAAESVKAAHIMCQSVADKVLELEALCGVVRSSDLPMFVPFVPTEAGADHLAAAVRAGLGIGSAVVSDVLELLEDAGLRVVFLDMPDGCPSFGGYDRVNRNAVLFVNSRLKKQPEFQVFRLVIELGRIYWYTRQLYGSTGKDAASALTAEEVALDEVSFARRFAISLLMPDAAVRSTAGQLRLTPNAWSWEILLRLKKRYGVSALNFAQRLHALKLSWSDKQKKSSRAFQFKEELDAFAAENGPTAEPGGNRPALAMNGRLCSLLLRAEKLAGKEQKPVNAVRRILRQSGVKLDA